MDAFKFIEYLREQNFTVKADGEYLELSPPEKITDELIQRLRKHKPAIMAELKRESWRLNLMAMLADNPKLQRAFKTNADVDSDNIVLSMAIRDVASFEMLIPRDKYDGFMLLELIEKGSLQ